eukprot:CAMPEP_0204899666 /NCGR_PEP_ID=MMETSP1397-20131031/1985_1 /ASSEMBLY_ACC=CAM_ASM_000891 /TAXON_ID=49980 /ORGANISM="Climacostomum Climacostomum virens, Strain Stock W-24" /LENGTH=141 /DNA_ID=CAMNT_0052067647 /DNA_START=2389 /DNA_END=2814 /DNA_ORIENTATION=-
MLALTKVKANETPEFVKGFVNGLEKDPNNPSHCSTAAEDFSQYWDQIKESIVVDKDVIEMVFSMRRYFDKLSDVIEICKFDLLYDKIKTFTPEQLAIVAMANFNFYKTNLTTLASYIEANDNYAAGQVVGRMVSKTYYFYL